MVAPVRVVLEAPVVLAQDALDPAVGPLDRRRRVTPRVGRRIGRAGRPAPGRRAGSRCAEAKAPAAQATAQTATRTSSSSRVWPPRIPCSTSTRSRARRSRPRSSSPLTSRKARAAATSDSLARSVSAATVTTGRAVRGAVEVDPHLPLRGPDEAAPGGIAGVETDVGPKRPADGGNGGSPDPARADNIAGELVWCFGDRTRRRGERERAARAGAGDRGDPVAERTRRRRRPLRAQRRRPTGRSACAATLEELGPTCVKLGQILSTRRDLLPPAYSGRAREAAGRRDPGAVGRSSRG